jgi:hypothetical protein
MQDMLPFSRAFSLSAADVDRALAAWHRLVATRT